MSNPVDHVSRGLYPQELAKCELWWKGPEWLCFLQKDWPDIPQLVDRPLPVEEKEPFLNVHVALVAHPVELPLLGQVFSFTRLKQVTAWILGFVHNTSFKDEDQRNKHPSLKSKELSCAE